MDIVRNAAELRARLGREPECAFVPTMGALHEGHLALVRAARARSHCTVVSVFVNRLQFGPGEDFERYPRALEADCEQLRAVGVDVVFAPEEAEIYPEPQTFLVEPSPLQHVLEGAHRPGHFRGVATVVLKLFHMVMPRVAVFGKKDYQQYVLVRDMVRQLALPIEIVAVETVRAADGLALSSRNAYLSPAERREAPRLYRQLARVRSELERGARDYAGLERAAEAELARHGWRPDYVAVRRRADLEPPGPADRALIVLGAARLGSTRLIDNVEADAAP